MEPFLTKSQKIKVTCIVRYNDKVLLLRRNQVVDPEHQPRGGYFYVPSFTVSFGEDPVTMLQDTLEAYLGQSVAEISMRDLRHYMADDNTTQVFEVVYTAQTARDLETNERYDRLLFVEAHQLDAYMFPQEREHLEKYL